MLTMNAYIVNEYNDCQRKQSNTLLIDQTSYNLSSFSPVQFANDSSSTVIVIKEEYILLYTYVNTVSNITILFIIYIKAILWNTCLKSKCLSKKRNSVSMFAKTFSFTPCLLPVIRCHSYSILTLWFLGDNCGSGTISARLVLHYIGQSSCNNLDIRLVSSFSNCVPVVCSLSLKRQSHLNPVLLLASC